MEILPASATNSTSLTRSYRISALMTYKHQGEHSFADGHGIHYEVIREF